MDRNVSKDISVIVQGAINKTETKKCLKSIRQFLPEAEIILSTWEGSDVSSLKGLYDILILNKDPGATLLEETKTKKVYNNLNRQLVSTKAGLKKSSRRYAMKLRSDLILTSDKFLEYFDKFEARSEDYNLFKHKILTSTLFSRCYIKPSKLSKRVFIPFHISDWWLFGLREDLETYFLATELVKEPEFTKYFSLEENKTKLTPYSKVKFKFAPEQYFGYSCFARNFDDIYMEDASDYSEELMEKYRKCLLNNFIILDFKHSGIYLNKYLFSKNEKLIGDQYIDLYNPYRYQKDYKEICDNEFLITETPILEDKKTYSKMRIYKKLYRLIEHNLPINKKLATLFFELPYSIIMFILDSLKSNNPNL